MWRTIATPGVAVATPTFTAILFWCGYKGQAPSSSFGATVSATSWKLCREDWWPSPIVCTHIQYDKESPGPRG